MKRRRTNEYQEIQSTFVVGAHCADGDFDHRRHRGQHDRKSVRHHPELALNASTYKIIKGDTTEDTEYFKAGFTSDEEREAYEAELCATVEAEGAALLKNDNAALPLADSAKVSLFGHGSVDLMYGGTGSGSVIPARPPT